MEKYRGFIPFSGYSGSYAGMLFRRPGRFEGEDVYKRQEVHTIAAESLETMLEKEAQDYWNLEISSIAEESVKGLTVTYEDKTTDLKRNVIETTDDDGNLSSDTIYTLDGIEIDSCV